jgi:ATP adenylyltransferase
MSENKNDAGSGTPGAAKTSQIHTRGAAKIAGGQDATDPTLGNATLQAPWRLEYLERLSQEEKLKGAPGTGCFLRDAWLAPQLDVENLVVVRARDGLIMLNRFPYANGHLLVALGEGRGRLGDYSPDERAALWRLTDAAAELMEETLEPQGINIGVNQGRAAGAGVPQHLHVHLVPRWSGDVNFMTVVGRIRVMPSSLETMAGRYRGAWERIRGRWAGLLGV